MSGKRPTDHLEPSAKKRTQDRQGRKGDEDEEDAEDEQPGEFAKASEEVLRNRRIIKARRAGGGLASTQPAAAAVNGATPAEAPASAPKSSNPFAGVSLLAHQPQAPATPGAPTAPEPPAASAAPAASAKAELGSEDAVVGAGGDANDEAASSPLGTAAPPASGAAVEQPGGAAAAQGAEAAAGAKPQEHAPPADPPASAASAEGSSGMPPVSSAAPGAAAAGGFSFGGNLAKSVGGFGGGGGSGFGALAGAASSSGGFAAFGSRPGAGDADSSAGGLFGSKPAFAFGASADADASTPAQSVFGGAATDAKQDAPAAGRAVVLAAGERVETGEEGERTVFAGDGTLFSFDTAGWRERGRGELRVKVDRLGQARLVMRQRGNLRLLLNANLWDDMAVNVMDGGVGVTFAVQNAVAVPAAGGKDGGAKDSATAGTPPAKEEASDAKLELTTFAFRVKAKQTLEEFKSAVESYKKADAAAANV